MRTDLTTAFTSAMQAAHRQPRQLLVFYFPVSGVVRLSDQELGPADGLADTYQGLVEEWGQLGDIMGSSPADQTSETRQLTVTIFNGGDSPFSNYFLTQDPENVAVELWQWFAGAGLTDDDRALVERFTVADPIRFAEASALLELDLVSLNLRYDQPLGDLLLADTWPTAKTADLGKGVDLILGNPGRVPTICAREAPAASLAGSILATTTRVDVYEDLNKAGFSPSGVLQIDGELLRYSSRTASRFTIATNGRGYTSTAAEHLDRAAIREVIADQTFLLGKGPLGAISEVQVAGYPAPAGIYTTHPELDPARVVFSQPPYGLGYATGSSFLGMQFDAIGSGNTAVQPHLAYDAADDATAARIDKDHRKLALLQATVNPDRGQIVKAYLAVEHWADKNYVYDRCRVSVDGIGVVGYLSRPNPADTLDIEAEVDIDHGHTHQIGGDHTHAFSDPEYLVDAEQHTHPTTGLDTTTTHPPDPEGGHSFTDLFEEHVKIFPSAPRTWSGAVLTFKASVGNGCKLFGPGGWINTGVHQVALGPRDATHVFSAKWELRELELGGYANIYAISLEVWQDVDIESVDIQVGVDTAVSGSNQAAGDKAQDDVDDLATDNQAIEVTAEQTATHSHVNLFDITGAVNFSWAWFTGRRVTVEYLSSADAARVYVLHCFFDIEYRKKQEIFSDAITAQVAGLVDDAAGTITGTPGAEIARPDQVRRYLLTQCADLPAAYIDSASEAAAGARYDALGYRFDGVLAAATTVREATNALATQCRSRWFWGAGVAKITVKERLEDWTAQRSLTAPDLQLRSLAAERQPVADLINKIDLFYSRDWTSTASGAAAYQASASAQEADSIAQHGILAEPGRWLFDQVGDAAMAADLAAYYCRRLAYPATYYTLATYLPQFDLEKGDVLEVSANFGKLRKALMQIVALGRQFGSGKNGAINLVPILAECVRYVLLEVSAADTIALVESLSFELGFTGFFEDAVPITEQLIHAHTHPEGDTLSLAEVVVAELLYHLGLTDAVTITDTLAAHPTVAIEEEVVLYEDYQGWRHFGYGGGQYGGGGYGGAIIYTNRHPDTLAVWEDLVVALVAGAFPEAITLAEHLAASDGYGSPSVGDGWGACAYGI